MRPQVQVLSPRPKLHIMKTNIPTPKGEEKIVSRGNILELVQQDMQIGSKVVTFEKARRASGVRLIIISPDNKILLSKEWRIELKDWDFRLPGGKVFDKLTDYNNFLSIKRDILKQAEEAAIKEASEEVGIVVKSLKHFHTSRCGATVEWDLYYFVVKDFSKNEIQKLEHGENIEVGWYTFKDAKEILLSGKVKEDRSVGVLLRFILTS